VEQRREKNFNPEVCSQLGTIHVKIKACVCLITLGAHKVLHRRSRQACFWKQWGKHLISLSDNSLLGKAKEKRVQSGHKRGFFKFARNFQRVTVSLVLKNKIKLNQNVNHDLC